MSKIPYLLLRDVDPQTYNRVRKLAKLHRKSLSETVRDLLKRHLAIEHPHLTKQSAFPTPRKAKIKVRRI